MEFFFLSQAFNLLMAVFFLFLILKVLLLFWVTPLRVRHRLQKNGFGGPTPRFPLGNIEEMKKKREGVTPLESSDNSIISHDIHSNVFPYFARWQKSHGKPFEYVYH